jgi:hypothetical protein
MLKAYSMTYLAAAACIVCSPGIADMSRLRKATELRWEG